MPKMAKSYTTSNLQDGPNTPPPPNYSKSSEGEPYESYVLQSESSTSLPGGNQVDGLPPAFSSAAVGYSASFANLKLCGRAQFFVSIRNISLTEFDKIWSNHVTYVISFILDIRNLLKKIFAVSNQVIFLLNMSKNSQKKCNFEFFINLFAFNVCSFFVAILYENFA